MKESSDINLNSAAGRRKKKKKKTDRIKTRGRLVRF